MTGECPNCGVDIDAQATELDQLRADNARLKSRVEGYEKQWTDMDYTIGKCLEQLATYKAAVVEARKALEAANSMPICASCNEVPKALHTLSALTGETPKTGIG